MECLIETGLKDPIAVGLAKSLFDEAGIPYFTKNETMGAQRDYEALAGWWTILVPSEREDEAREILLSVQQTA